VRDARKLLVSPVEQQRHSRTILDIRCVHLRSKNQSTGVDEDVAFSAIDALGSVVAADAVDTRGANRLPVDDASTRFRVASNSRAELLA
jgi:hypothetical protein